MPFSNQALRVIRFGPFEADLDAGVLRKDGNRIRLQAQPFQVLAILLENAGAVVTREELRQRLWSNDTFVDFENGLNAAVTRVRHALGDSAKQPRYIETLPKRGYRFTAELEAVPAKREEPATVPRSKLRRRLAGLLAAAAALILVIAIGGTYRVSRDETPAFHPVPLTSFPGRESSPALSPDGNSVAFSWDGEKEHNFDIYVLPLHATVPRRLTTDAAHDLSPAWSPDGGTIAFLRRTGEGYGELMLVPAAGGPERKIGEVRNDDLQPMRSPPIGVRISSVSWSRDMRWLAVSHREPHDMAERIYLFSVTGGKRPLTKPPIGYQGDHMPAFSPDGKMIAFCRLPGFSNSEIFVLPLDGNLQPTGDPRGVTNYKRWSINPVWTPDGRSLLYVFDERPESLRGALRAIDLLGSRISERTIPLSEPVYHISAGRHLVYSQLTEEADIYRARLPAPGEPPTKADVFLSSTKLDTKASYSPDGSMIVFTSERSGSPELWIAGADGSNPVRVTDLRGPLVGPGAWSPDGQRLVFHARPDGQADLFVIPAAGGAPKKLTNHPSDDVVPSYSHDGRWIYFTSMRSGKYQVWKMPSTGGAAVAITSGGGFRPIESPDGKRIFYEAIDGSGIWQVAVNGGAETLVVSPLHERPTGFAVTNEGVYYQAPAHSGDQRYIRFFNFTTRQSRPVVEAERPFGWSASVSPDGQYYLLEQWEKAKLDLMLIENFQIR